MESYKMRSNTLLHKSFFHMVENIYLCERRSACNKRSEKNVIFSCGLHTHTRKSDFHVWFLCRLYVKIKFQKKIKNKKTLESRRIDRAHRRPSRARRWRIRLLWGRRRRIRPLAAASLQACHCHALPLLSPPPRPDVVPWARDRCHRRRCARCHRECCREVRMRGG